MPILVDRGPGGCTIMAATDTATERSHARRRPAGGEWIEIGLVNNMPDAALEATEQQFLDLLGAAAGDSWIHLRFFSLPGVPRSERGRRFLSRSYADVADMAKADLDALIVTGAEPKAANLADEPYWRAFTQLVDWAAGNTISTIWSCLAAHAAVLHLDQIERVALREKCIGVFDCDRLAEHPLTLNLPPRSGVPHARWNALSEAALVASGYQVLTRSPVAGVDTFVRQDFARQDFACQARSLFLFFQGHPEYGAGSLLNEFRRDVGRFLKGERERYPTMPQHYFDPQTEAALVAFAQQARRQRSEDLLADFPVRADPNTSWRPFGVTIYRNWLSVISAHKQRLKRPAQYMAALRLDQSPAPAI